MKNSTMERPVDEECERFLDGIVAHHDRRDAYPDPYTVGAELGYRPARTAAVLRALAARRWIARSPYALDCIRITPRGWEYLCRRGAARDRSRVA